MDSKKIVAWVKEPGKAPEKREVSDDLKTLQSIVGGYVETVTFGDVVVLCDEEGKLKGKPKNCIVVTASRLPVAFVGTIALVGHDGEDFADCPKAPDAQGKDFSRVYLL